MPFGQAVSPAGVILALAGLYLLCVDGSLSIRPSDLLVLTCGILTAIPMVVFEMEHTPESLGHWAGSLVTLDAWNPSFPCWRAG